MPGFRNAWGRDRNMYVPSMFHQTHIHQRLVLSPVQNATSLNKRASSRQATLYNASRACKPRKVKAPDERHARIYKNSETGLEWANLAFSTSTFTMRSFNAERCYDETNIRPLKHQINTQKNTNKPQIASPRLVCI